MDNALEGQTGGRCFTTSLSLNATYTSTIFQKVYSYDHLNGTYRVLGDTVNKKCGDFISLGVSNHAIISGTASGT